jgi:gamma-glutamyltranspeptidase / glutathione hydrolase
MRIGTIVAGLLATLPLAPTTAFAQVDTPTILHPEAARDDGLRAALATAKPVLARKAMVVSAQHLATRIGVDILKMGGNAIDAAVAVGYALAVVHPCCGNIGGGGFMLIHLHDGQNLFLDFREKAPLKADTKLFQDADGNVVPGRSTGSWLGVAVPGTVMGLNEALAKYGTMPLAKVIAPAIDLARKGYVLEPGDVKIMDGRAQGFASEPNVAAIFLNQGRPFVAGERMFQPQLANTLEMIAKGGTRAFYHGAIPEKVAAASTAGGGLLTTEDFARYTVAWDKPVLCQYRGRTVVAAPPPSSGGATVCEILQTIEGYPLANWGYGSIQATHVLVEAERHAYADRNIELGDPAFVKNPVAQLISPERATAIRARIQPDRATPSSEVRPGEAGSPEGTETTHYSVLDAKGNAVSVTYTINYLFGVGKMAGDTGFFLNNEMDDFTSKPGVPNGFGLVQGSANAVAGGKRPLSSMSPTILLQNGEPYMITGSPGGSTIITTVVQGIVNVVDFGMNAQAAVDAPRFHHQWLPDLITVEPGYLTADTQAGLEKMGYKIRAGSFWGANETILVDGTGTVQGANDRRRPAGLAAGY